MRKTIRDTSLIISAGLLYYLINRFTGLGIPCLFRSFTGLPCPSCGITHMFIHLIEFEPASAFGDNEFLFLTWPLAALEIIYITFKTESRKDLPKVNVLLIGIYGAALLIFGILRIMILINFKL